MGFAEKSHPEQEYKQGIASTLVGNGYGPLTTGVEKLYAKLLKVTGSLGWVEKRGNNTAQNYQYVMADDVAAAVREKLVAEGVALTASVVSTSTREFESGTGKKIRITTVQVAWTFCDTETGATATVMCPGEAMDAGDKAIYKAMTGSLKYAMKLNFLLPTGEDPEEDGALDNEVYNAPAPAPRPAAPARSSPAAGSGVQGARQPAPAAKAPQAAPAALKVPYGRHKGKDFSDPSIPDSDLEWLIGKFEEAVAKNDEKWHTKNVQVLGVAQTEMARRTLGATQDAQPQQDEDIPF